jgi:hypothetical protein
MAIVLASPAERFELFETACGDSSLFDADTAYFHSIHIGFETAPQDLVILSLE